MQTFAQSTINHLAVRKPVCWLNPQCQVLSPLWLLFLAISRSPIKVTIHQIWCGDRYWPSEGHR